MRKDGLKKRKEKRERMRKGGLKKRKEKGERKCNPIKRK